MEPITKITKYLLPSNESIHIKEAMIMYIFNKWTNLKDDSKKTASSANNQFFTAQEGAK